MLDGAPNFLQKSCPVIDGRFQFLTKEEQAAFDAKERVVNILAGGEVTEEDVLILSEAGLNTCEISKLKAIGALRNSPSGKTIH